VIRLKKLQFDSDFFANRKSLVTQATYFTAL